MLHCILIPFPSPSCIIPYTWFHHSIIISYYPLQHYFHIATLECLNIFQSRRNCLMTSIRQKIFWKKIFAKKTFKIQQLLTNLFYSAAAAQSGRLSRWRRTGDCNNDLIKQPQHKVMLFVIWLSMLMILHSILSVTEHLICGRKLKWLLNFNLIYETP